MLSAKAYNHKTRWATHDGGRSQAASNSKAHARHQEDLAQSSVSSLSKYHMSPDSASYKGKVVSIPRYGRQEGLMVAANEGSAEMSDPATTPITDG